MARRQEGVLNLNFDGLTDAVTNLVGALIILVVLLLWITKEAPTKEVLATAPTVHGVPEEALEGEKTVETLRRKTEALRAQVLAADREIKRLKDNRLPELRKKVDMIVSSEIGPTT